jgi:hypothetical protein
VWLLLACPLAATADPADPDDPGSIGIGLVPDADSSPDPRSRMYIVDHVAPGTEVRREIMVQNASPRPQHVELYASAAEIDGEAFVAVVERGGNDLSEWTTLERPSLDLEPGETERVGVTIAVPRTASEGERYAAVLAEVASPATETGALQQVNRVGIRVYLSVGPGGEPPTDFTIDDLEVHVPARGGWPVLRAQVTNAGERALDLSGEATLRREGGTITAGPFTTTAVVSVAPGGSGTVDIVLDEPLPGGAWHAEATLRSGDVERTAEARVQLPDFEGPQRSDRSGMVAGLIAGLVVAVALSLLVLARWHRARPT